MIAADDCYTSDHVMSGVFKRLVSLLLLVIEGGKECQ